MGVLTLFCLTGPNAFDDQALQLAQVYADQAAVFIENARLIDVLRRSAVQLEERVRQRTEQLEEAQAQVIRAEKLAAVGRLAASVAHEVNNSLQAISLHLQLLGEEALSAEGLRAILARDDHDVRDVSTAEEAVEVLETFAIEVAIVDIRMPGMSGTDLLALSRRRWPYLAVVLLTGHGTLETAITAVKQGAHDYLLKPAQADEIRTVIDQALASARREREETQLLDTMRTTLQRIDGLDEAQAKPTQEQGRLTIGDLHIDLQAHKVLRRDEPVSLTPTEYQLLLVLARRKGEAIDYVTLAQLVLEYEAELWEAKELIKRHAFALRQKIEPDPAQPAYVVNVRSVGNRLDVPES